MQGSERAHVPEILARELSWSGVSRSLAAILEG